MQDDLIRYEKAEYKNVLEMINLAKQSGAKKSNIILYHLDEKSIENFGTENIKRVFTSL